MRLIENHALREKMTLQSSARIIFADDRLWPLITSAFGDKATTLPNTRQVRALRDKEKLRWAKLWPDQWNPKFKAKSAAHKWVSPYLPIPKRYEPPITPKRVYARRMRDRGRTPKHIAAHYGVTIDTVYRWLRK